MTGLDIADFTAFFTEVHGYPPFAWQSRLCQMIADNGEWPDTISAPTGAGKSNVVDVHAFVNALYGWGNGPRVPRRLAVVVNRRTIVDAHEQRALDLQTILKDPRTDVVACVAEGLRRLRHDSVDSDNVLALATLRGGLLPDRSWVDDPTSCTVICATPDMWGSRLLFGGYGSSRQAHPREAGLLAFDSVMVLDEAHLNSQLLVTARRVRELIQRHPTPAPELQIVETTATPAGDSGTRSAGVDDSDLATDHTLAQRLTRPKPVTYHPTDSWPDKRASDKYIDEIADTVIEVRKSTPDGTVGCIVNTVRTAVRVAKRLEDRLAAEPTQSHVLTWVGPMRPMDLQAQMDEHPGAFRPEGDSTVGVIVATQTIEVGVDIDFAALVTELAPGSALAQRAGRVNRLGTRESGPITVIGPQGAPNRSGPYEAEELRDALEWVMRRATDPAGLAPSAIAQDRAPSALHKRLVYSRLEAGDVEALATTSEDLAAPQERSLWLRDDLEPENQDCNVVLRKGLPLNDLDALVLLQVTPPATREIFTVPIHRAHEICRALGKLEAPNGRVFVWRDGGITRMELDDGNGPRPGDVLILDSNHPLVLVHTIVEYGDGEEDHSAEWGASGIRVLWREEDPDLFATIDDVVTDQKHVPETIQSLVNDSTDRSYQVIAGRPLEGDSDGAVPWLVFKPTDVVIEDEETRQIWSGTNFVELSAHSDAVAARARALATHLSLSETEVTALELAGRHHDDGKRDNRFQILLGKEADGPTLAKSGGISSRRAQLNKQRAGLPPRWRHEQLSVVIAHDELRDLPRDQRELVLRLVGTSHGRGRLSFPHGATHLLDPGDRTHQAAAVDFYDRGAWEELIEHTHRSLGPWACALYEALLRAADCTVSKEGS